MLAGKNKKKVEKGTSGVETDEQLIQRVPLAIPVVKIFKLNSQAVLEQGVPSIIAKIGSFLKSRVRKCLFNIT